jgi:hypothetical protein
LFALYLTALQRTFVKGFGTLSGSRCVLRAATSDGCPALVGVLRPKVILPADFDSRYTRLERLLVFAHERSHLRRGDPVWNACAALMRCLFWYNPLVHLAAGCFRADQELACDAAVMGAHPGSPRAYASAMLKTTLADSASLIVCHWHSVRHIKERILMLNRAIPGRTRRTCGQMLVVLSGAVLGYAAWAAEPATAPGSVTTTAHPGPGAAAAAPGAVSLNVGDQELLLAGTAPNQTLSGDALIPLLVFSADQANARPERNPPDGGVAGSPPPTTIIMQGHVIFRVLFTFAASPQSQTPMVVIRRSPAASQAQTLEAHTVLVHAESAVVFSHPRIHSVRWDEGCTVTLVDASGRDLESVSGATCRMRVP